jgi:hypothetical protein
MVLCKKKKNWFDKCDGKWTQQSVTINSLNAPSPCDVSYGFASCFCLFWLLLIQSVGNAQTDIQIAKKTVGSVAVLILLAHMPGHVIRNEPWPYHMMGHAGIS